MENHGISEETIQHVFDQSKAFFDLEIDAKMAVKLDKNNRGYRPMGKEMVNKDNQSKGDTKVGSPPLSNALPSLIANKS